MTQHRAIGLDDELRFGKYQGDEFWLVVETDPEYVWWCIENVDGFELDNEAYKALKEQSRR